MASDNNRLVLNRCEEDIEEHLAIFLQTGLVQGYFDLDLLLKAAEFDVETQLPLIRENAMNHCTTSNIQRRAVIGNASAPTLPVSVPKKRKLENAGEVEGGKSGSLNNPSDSCTHNTKRLFVNSLIAQIVKCATPVITTFRHNLALMENARILMIRGQENNEQSYQADFSGFLEQTFLKHELENLMKMRDVSVKFHQNLSDYHVKRAQLIKDLCDGCPTDLLMAIGELDVSIFLRIQETLRDIRNAYYVGLKFDKILSGLTDRNLNTSTRGEQD